MVSLPENEPALAGDDAEGIRELWKALAAVSGAVCRLAQAHLSANQQGSALPALSCSSGVTLLEVVNELLSTKARGNRSDGYMEQLRYCFSGFTRGRSTRAIDSLTTKELETFLEQLEVAPRTIKGRIQNLRLLFNYAHRRGYVDRNPAAALELPTQDVEKIGIHTPDQVKAVLAAAMAQHGGVAKALAIRYFAGLRRSELERLEECEIHLDQRRIEITAAKSKTRRRRLVTIQDNLAAWLALTDGIPGDMEKRVTQAWKKAGVPWPRNAPRHSFVSYHLARFENAAKTALEAGHTEQMLFAHYRELVTPAAAAEYWSIVPPMEPAGPPAGSPAGKGE